MEFSKRLDLFGDEIFAALNERKVALEAQGRTIYNLSVGTPDFAPAEHIRKAMMDAAADPQNWKYSLRDLPELLDAVCGYYKRRFGVEITPDQVASCAGSQEGVGHIGMVLCDEGDTVLLPTPCYPVFIAGSLLGGVLTVAFILFAVILENSITTRRQLDTLLLLLVMAGTAVALYGICQYLFGWGYQSAAWADSEMFGDVFRVPSTLENPNMLGQYLILAIPLGGAGLLAAKDWGMRVFYFCCCGVMCVCMLLTLSRGAWLGLLFAGFVFVLFLQPRLLLLTPLLLVGLYFVLPDAVINRFASIGNLGDSSTSYRVYIWMGTLAMLKDYWMCGIGPGDAAFNLVYPKYSYSGIVAPHAHNLFLQIVCDAGVVALVVFVLLLFHYFRDLCAAFCREKDPFSRLYQTAAVSGIAGFLVQAMTDYSFYNYRVLLLFWAWLALGALLARRGQLPERGLKV